MLASIKNQIIELVKSKILLNESFIKHTTFGVGGGASIFIYPRNKKDLKKVLKFCSTNNIKIFFIGSGSNLLVSDKGFDGIVICLQKTFKKFELKSSLEATIESGVMLGNVVKVLSKKSITGLESLIGVPGTLGGALIMNAGAYGREISNYLVDITVLDLNGVEKIYKKNDLKFSYRFSSIPREEIIVEAKFKFEKGNIDNIEKNKAIVSEQRKEKQPLKFRSAGSIFKNPNSKTAAGYLIDQVNLKGTRIGDAEISKKHANFIINHGSASSNDILKLIKIAKNAVKETFNINLELEVKLLGFHKEELNGIA